MTAGRRRVLLRVVGRVVATAVALLGIYSVAPVGSVGTGEVVLRMLGCAVVFVWTISWHVRGIINSERPQLRALEAAFASIFLLLTSFSYVYISLSDTNSASFNQDLDRPGAFYFTTTVFSTVGFGDIVPVSTGARMVVTAQMLVNLAVLGFVVRSLFDVASKGLAERSRSKADPDSDADAQ